MTIIAPMRRTTRAAAAGGAMSIPNTSSVPTVWNETTTVSATSSSMMRVVPARREAGHVGLLAGRS